MGFILFTMRKQSLMTEKFRLEQRLMTLTDQLRSAQDAANKLQQDKKNIKDGISMTGEMSSAAASMAGPVGSIFAMGINQATNQACKATDFAMKPQELMLAKEGSDLELQKTQTETRLKTIGVEIESLEKSEDKAIKSAFGFKTDVNA